MSRRTRPQPRARRRGFALIEVVVGGILLAIGLGGVLMISTRALEMQRRGERDVVAATLLDDLLSNVLSDGPKDYVELHQLTGNFMSPFEEYEYSLDIDDGSPGVPYRVTATVTHPSGQRWQCETFMAPRLGDEPNPVRMPEEPIDRNARYQEQEDKINGITR